MPLISNQGVRQDLVVVQGADFLTSWTFLNPDGTPMDLTNTTHAASIVKVPGAPILASFLLTVAANVVSGRIPAIVAAALQCGPTLTDPLSLYCWDYKFTDASGLIWRIFYGNVQVFRDITP